MKILRSILVLAVIGYAGWLAWPFISPFFAGAEPTVATERASVVVEAGGGIPQAVFWIGALVHSLRWPRSFGLLAAARHTHIRHGG